MKEAISVESHILYDTVYMKCHTIYVALLHIRRNSETESRVIIVRDRERRIVSDY